MRTGASSGSAARLGIAAAMVAAGCAIYLPAVHGGWLWDDSAEVAANPALRTVGGLADIWKGKVGDDYFPLKSTFQWIEWHLWGGHVEGYHLVNLVLHLLSGFLLWRLLDRLGLKFGWVGALIWVVHPVAVESVTWISEFKNTLSTPFLLLAAIAYVEADRSEERVGRRYVLSLLWFLAALLSKTSVVAFPIVLCLYEGLGKDRPRWARSAPFFALSCILGAVTVWFQDHRILERTAMPVASLGSRLGSAFWELAFYVRHALIAQPLLSLYPESAARASAAGIVTWLLLILVIVWAWRKRLTVGRAVLLGVGFFLVNLLPVLGVIPLAYSRIAPVADHLSYLSLLGCAGLAAASAEWVATKAPRIIRGLCAAAGCGLVILCIVEASAATGPYHSDKDYWTEAAKKNPEAWLAHNNLALDFLSEGRIDLAIQEMRQAETLRPAFPEVRANAGAVLLEAGQIPEALAESQEAVRLGPNLAGAHMTLGRAFLAEGRLDEAARQLAIALGLDPTSAATYNNLGILAASRQDWTQAIGDYGRAIELDPGHAETWNNLGSALGHLGRWDEAISRYTQALHLRPQFPQCENNFGNALAASGKPEAAIAHYRAALQLRPNDPGTRRNLALALHALGRDAEADSEAAEAERLSRRP